MLESSVGTGNGSTLVEVFLIFFVFRLRFKEPGVRFDLRRFKEAALLTVLRFASSLVHSTSDVTPFSELLELKLFELLAE